MSTMSPYTFVVLRYVHDAACGEFVNIGLVLCCPKAGFLGERTKASFGRVAAVFPDLDREGYRAAVGAVRRSVTRLKREIKTADLLRDTWDASTLAKRIVPTDDSSLQWSNMGGGLTDDPNATLERLYNRLVGRYDSGAPVRRSDDDVWRPVRDLLADRNIEEKLTETVIKGQDDIINFRHAWKNGKWHCIQPLSFDLSNADNIKDKARRWTGHLAAVRDVSDQFMPYFIVSKPSDETLEDAYETAISILRKGPVAVEIYTDDRAEQLVSVIENEMREHDEQIHPI
jgi:hypothetical protein